MSYSTQYYWQIVSWDNHGASNPGPIWSFTTGQEINNPPVIDDELPINGSTDVIRPPDQLRVTIEDSDGDDLNISIRWKHHNDTWVTLAEYLMIGDGTYTYITPVDNDWIWGNTTYTWNVNATDPSGSGS